MSNILMRIVFLRILFFCRNILFLMSCFHRLSSRSFCCLFCIAVQAGKLLGLFGVFPGIFFFIGQEFLLSFFDFLGF